MTDAATPTRRQLRLRDLEKRAEDLEVVIQDLVAALTAPSADRMADHERAQLREWLEDAKREQVQALRKIRQLRAAR